ncbi:hypothetical protein, variant [Exophiala sideris]|uniref:Uncharacterized protein n=1 Tax=Exophiala sideris TaxID=1016849 RepID=A0A0D1YUM2_9EURO|nr:hypothetical protein, variant [Exophiala sideris]
MSILGSRSGILWLRSARPFVLSICAVFSSSLSEHLRYHLSCRGTTFWQQGRVRLPPRTYKISQTYILTSSTGCLKPSTILSFGLPFSTKPWGCLRRCRHNVPIPSLRWTRKVCSLNHKEKKEKFSEVGENYGQPAHVPESSPRDRHQVSSLDVTMGASISRPSVHSLVVGAHSADGMYQIIDGCRPNASVYPPPGHRRRASRTSRPSSESASLL